MRATAKLNQAGQSLWLDNITRAMLDSGEIAHYVERYSVTGLTSNPSIFDKAIQSGDYDADIREKVSRGLSGEDLFFDLAIEDLRRAADPSSPFTSAPTAWTVGSRSRCRPSSCTTRSARSPPQGHSTSAPADRTSFSRFPARSRGAPRSRIASRRASPSTSRCSSRPTSIAQPRRRTCAASSGASAPG